MNEQEADPAITDLRAELARLRRLVLVLAAPWVLVILGAMAPSQPDVVTARRFVVVDEHGVPRVTLAAPTKMVSPTFHAEAVPTVTPQLTLSYEDGREIRIGGAKPVVRITSSDKEWWAGLHAAGFFSVQENDSVNAAATISPFNLNLSVSGEDPYRNITLEMFGDGDRPEVVITEGDEEKAVRAD